MASKDLMEQARYYCAYQERCHQDVRNKLLELSFRGEDLEHALSILIQENFLNEERFARSYCRSKFNYNKWGRVKIIQSLKQKNVSEYCIKKGLSEIGAHEYEKAFRDLFNKKWDSLKKEKNIWIKKKKVRDYLSTKGFESGMIYEALNCYSSK